MQIMNRKTLLLNPDHPLIIALRDKADTIQAEADAAADTDGENDNEQVAKEGEEGNDTVPSAPHQ